MASGAVLAVKEIELYDLAWWNHHGIGTRGARRTAASGASEDRNDRKSDENRSTIHYGCPSPSFSSIAPGASIPARTANGIYCQVRMRCCLETTMPATRPKPICEITNQNQSMRWLSTGLIAS